MGVEAKSQDIMLYANSQKNVGNSAQNSPLNGMLHAWTQEDGKLHSNDQLQFMISYFDFISTYDIFPLMLKHPNGFLVSSLPLGA